MIFEMECSRNSAAGGRVPAREPLAGCLNAPSAMGSASRLATARAAKGTWNAASSPTVKPAARPSRVVAPRPSMGTQRADPGPAINPGIRLQRAPIGAPRSRTSRSGTQTADIQAGRAAMLEPPQASSARDVMGTSRIGRPTGSSRRASSGSRSQGTVGPARVYGSQAAQAPGLSAAAPASRIARPPVSRGSSSLQRVAGELAATSPAARRPPVCFLCPCSHQLPPNRDL